ncbi:hypothetical protein LtaPh_0406100 [Leishmania tarentolae]|uniref:Uncharacterized protein n=1 Tax=Leishmania tarentolae TaxID=5689 RepID=A0A640K8P6_LEITA|nr:hypothetical protein LtaPh_0406100 [Leishmania tarentolae]
MPPQHQRPVCPLSSVPATKPPPRWGPTEGKHDNSRKDSKHNDSGCAPSAEEDSVIHASTHVLWEHLYAPARVPLALERLLYLRLSAKGNGERRDALSHCHGSDDLQWAKSLLGEVTAHSDASAPSASMAPSTACAAAVDPEEPRGNPSNAIIAVAAAAEVSPQEHRDRKGEEEPQRTWKGCVSDIASSVAAPPTEPCASADGEQTSVLTPLRAPQACAMAESVSGVDSGCAPKPRSTVATVSHSDTVIATVSVSRPLSSVQRGSKSNRDIDNHDGRGSAVLLRPWRESSTVVPSPPDGVLPVSMSDVSLTCASAPAALAAAAAPPMSIEQDDSASRIDRNEDAEPHDDTCLVEATSTATVATEKEGRLGGPGRDVGCRPPLAYSAGRGSDGEDHGAVDDEQTHTLVQAKAVKSSGAQESTAITGTPVRSQRHHSPHRSSQDTDKSAEQGEHNENDDANLGRGGEENSDAEFLSLVTSPFAAAPEQRYPCPVEDGTYSDLTTPSPEPIVALEVTMITPAVSELPCSLTRDDEDGGQLASPTRRHGHATRVSTSMSPVAAPNGLVFSPPCRQQMRRQLQHRRPRPPRAVSDMVSAPHTPVPESPSQSLLLPSSCWSPMHPQERCPYDARSPPAAPPPVSPAPSRTHTVDNSAGATDDRCADNHAAHAAGMHVNNKVDAGVTVSHIRQECRTSAAATASVNTAEPRDTTALYSPVDSATCAVEAGEDGQGSRDGCSVAPAAVGVEDERVADDADDEDDEERNAAVPTLAASLSPQRPSLECPAHQRTTAAPPGVHEDFGTLCESSMEKRVPRANAIPTPVADVSVAPSSPWTSPPCHASHASFSLSKYDEDPQQRHPCPPLPEDKATRRSVSNMDFRWADEADGILRRQQQRVRSLQAARAASLAGGDMRRSPSTSRGSPGGGPQRYTPLSQDGTGTRLVRVQGGSESSYSISPQPQDPRAHHYPERSIIRPGGIEVEAVASHTDGNGMVNELGGIAFDSADPSTPPTAPLRQPPLASVAEGTTTVDASIPRTDRLPPQQQQQQQWQPSPHHTGAKRLREHHGGDDGRRDAARARRSPVPSRVPVLNQTVTKRTKGACSGRARPREGRRQHLRGDTASKVATRSILGASPANIFALPRTIPVGAEASIAAPPLTTAPPPASPSPPLLRPRVANCVSDPSSAAQAQKSAKGKRAHVGAASSPITAETSPARGTPSPESTNKR